MSNVTKVAVGVALAVIVSLVVVYWIWLRPEAPERAEPITAETPIPAPTPTPTLAERLSERLADVTLKTSDAIVRELVVQLSKRPELASWLANEDLVRRFVAAANNVAAGESPRRQLEFLRPDRSFKVIERGGRFYIDPESYSRYDTLAEVVSSLDAEDVVTLYRELEPLMDEAYREISPPGADFEERLLEAIDHLLEVEPVTGQVQVEEKTVTAYAFSDERLESLSEAQRQLLRMGPENVRTIQSALREIRDELLLDI